MQIKRYNKIKTFLEQETDIADYQIRYILFLVEDYGFAVASDTLKYLKNSKEGDTNHG